MLHTNVGRNNSLNKNRERYTFELCSGVRQWLNQITQRMSNKQMGCDKLLKIRKKNYNKFKFFIFCQLQGQTHRKISQFF